MLIRQPAPKMKEQERNNNSKKIKKKIIQQKNESPIRQEYHY